MTFTPTNPTEFEIKIIAQFQSAPEGSLAWECYQHAQFSWDNGVLNWVQAVAASQCFVDLYGMSDALIDTDELIRDPNGHCDALIALWRANWDHDEAPDADMPHFWSALYWFGIKMTVIDIMAQAGVHPD